MVADAPLATRAEWCAQVRRTGGLLLLAYSVATGLGAALTVFLVATPSTAIADGLRALLGSVALLLLCCCPGVLVCVLTDVTALYPRPPQDPEQPQPTPAARATEMREIMGDVIVV